MSLGIGIGLGQNRGVVVNAPAARQAVFFIDLGWLRGRCNDLLKTVNFETSFDVEQFVRFADGRRRTPQEAQLLRLYFYDSTGRDGGKTSLHQRIENTDRCRMRYGRLRKQQKTWVQKGVDTALVADLVRYGFTGVYQVAHIMTADTDFVEPIRYLSDQGLQIVMYEFEELDERQQLREELRSQTDAVVGISEHAAADIFGARRYRLNISSGLSDAGELVRKCFREAEFFVNHTNSEAEFVVKIHPATQDLEALEPEILHVRQEGDNLYSASLPGVGMREILGRVDGQGLEMALTAWQGRRFPNPAV